MQILARIVVLASMFCFVVTPAFAQWGIFDQLADWDSRGSVKVPGDVQVTGQGLDAVYELWGNGDDIWESVDEGLFVYANREGSWSLQARVGWIDPGTNEWSKIGVMIREHGDMPESQHYWIMLRGNQFGDLAGPQWRPTEGGESFWQQAYYPDGHPSVGDAVNAFDDGMLWLRVTRIAPLNLVYSEVSNDGETWYTVHSQTQVMQDEVSFGLVITDHTDTQQLAHAEAMGVALYPAPTVGVRAFSHDSFMAGDTIQVSMTVLNAGDGPETVSVSETFPAGWTVSDISNGGVEADGTITWSYEAPAGESTLTYVLTAPQDPVASPAFSGTVGEMSTMGSTILPLDVRVTYGIFDRLADWEGRGSVKVPGEVEVEGEGEDAVYIIRGNGDDIWDNQDEGLYLFTERAGSWSLQARVEWLDPGTHEWSKVGVMIREKGLLPTSEHYWIALRGFGFGDSVYTQWRTLEGGESGSSQIFFPEGPFEGAPADAFTDGGIYLRVTRIVPLDLMVTEFSEDGETWYMAHSQTQSMQEIVSYGLAITDHTDTEQLAEAEVSNVKLIGTVGLRSFTDMAYTGGGDIGVTLSVMNSSDSAESVTIRETLPSGWSASDISDGGSVSAGTITWTIELDPGETELAYIATAPAAAEGGAVFSGQLEGLRIFGESSLPFVESVSIGIFDWLADWDSRGNVKVPGSAEVDGEGVDAVYTLAGNGDDIWDNIDEGLFLYTERAGNWSLEARVEWIEPGTNEWSKIGVMIREKGALPESQHYWVMLRGNQMGDLAGPQWRTTEGGASGWAQAYFPEDSPFAGAPFDASFDGTLWLRVTRLADTDEVFSEISEDGEVWYEVHRQAQPMQDVVAYGLVIDRKSVV